MFCVPHCPIYWNRCLQIFCFELYYKHTLQTLFLLKSSLNVITTISRDWGYMSLIPQNWKPATAFCIYYFQTCILYFLNCTTLYLTCQQFSFRSVARKGTEWGKIPSRGRANIFLEEGGINAKMHEYYGNFEFSSNF